MKAKIKLALERIAAQVSQHGEGLYVGHSGGKDSCVVHHLTTQVVPEVRVIHNSKLEPGKTHPLTLKFLYALSTKFPILFIGAERMPELFKTLGLSCQVDGTRRAEFDRTGKSDDVIIEGKSVNREDMPGYVERGIFDRSALYPIYDWSEAEVFQYIHDHGIELSAEYDNDPNKIA